MKLMSTICATALTAAMAVTSLAPVQAAPIVAPVAPAASSDVTQVDGTRWLRRGTGDNFQGHRYYRDGWNHNRHGWNRDRWDRWDRRDRYRDRNLGGALVGGLITGAIVGGVLNNGQRVYRGGDAHVQWCYDRYRTYRASDNTYVPRAGQRAYCNSPYN